MSSKSITINWPIIGGVLSTIAGSVGTIFTVLNRVALGTTVTAILQSLSAILIAIPVYHASSVAAATSKAMRLTRINSNVLFQAMQQPEHVSIIEPPFTAGGAPK